VARAARRLLVTGMEGTGKTFLAETILSASEFQRVFRLRLGKDMDAVYRQIEALLADQSIRAEEDGAFETFLGVLDQESIVVVDDFRADSEHGLHFLDLLCGLPSALIVVGIALCSISNRFEELLVCDLVETSDYEELPREMDLGALPYDQLQLIIGLAQTDPKYLERVLDHGDPISVILDILSPTCRRVAYVIAMLDVVVPESLLLCIEDSSAETASDILQLQELRTLQYANHGLLSERNAIVVSSVRRRLRANPDSESLVAAANAIRRCWNQKTAAEATQLSGRWALALITHGEALAELFTETLVYVDSDYADYALGAFCDHLTVLGSLYVYANRPQKALCSFKTSLSLISSLPKKHASHLLCMMRTLHCMANVYGSIGDASGQNRSLAAAFKIDAQLVRPQFKKPSQRKESRPRMGRRKLREISPAATSIVYLDGASRRQSFALEESEKKLLATPRKARPRQSSATSFNSL
jgi:hypothetical protein